MSGLAAEARRLKSAYAPLHRAVIRSVFLPASDWRVAMHRRWWARRSLSTPNIRARTVLLDQLLLTHEYCPS